VRAADAGLSLIELIIAMGLLLVVAGGIFGVLAPAQAAAVAEPEAADLQQRLRVASDTLYRDLLAAGSGPHAGSQSSALLYAFAPVLPFRRSQAAVDPAAAFSADAITLISVPENAAQTTLAADLSPGATTLQVVPESGCAAGVSLCRFNAGSTLLVYDGTGNFETFSLALVDDASGLLQVAARSPPTSTTTFRVGSRVVEAQARVYYLERDVATGAAQLMRVDDPAGAAVPVVDHLVGLTFEYYGEPRAPALIPPSSDPAGLWTTTYGPKPPPLDTAWTPYAPGENCVFQVDASGAAQMPRLVDLSDDLALVKLTAEQLTDGPWCPDASSGSRWDADLLRVRAVVVTVRVEAALAALRGPAGPLFGNGGLSRSASRWMPDVERQFMVSPRNLNLAR
jgi:Tfp pilus assembly protein PilV